MIPLAGNPTAVMVAAVAVPFAAVVTTVMRTMAFATMVLAAVMLAATVMFAATVLATAMTMVLDLNNRRVDGQRVWRNRRRCSRNDEHRGREYGRSDPGDQRHLLSLG